MSSIAPVWAGRRRGYLLQLIGIGAAQGGLALAVTMLVGRVFTLLEAGRSDGLDWTQLAVPAVAFVLLALGLGGLRLWQRVVAEILGQEYATAVRLQLFRHLLHSDQRAAQRFSHGAMMLRFVTDLEGLRRWVSLGLARLLVAGAMLITALGILVWLQPLLAALAAAAVFSGAGLSLLVGLGLAREVRQVRQRRAQLAANVNDRISTVPTIQVFSQQRRELRRVKKQSGRLTEAMIARARVVGGLRGTIEATTVITSALVLLIGAWLVAGGSLTAAAVVAGMTLVSLLLPPLRDLGRVFEYWQGWRISKEKAERFLTLPLALGSEEQSTELPPGPGILRASGLSIRDIVAPVDLEVYPGDRILLTGPNGSGKTTLLLTLAGLLRADGGEIYLDSYPIHVRGNAALGRAVGIVAPDLDLMRGSLERNLRYSRPRATDEELQSVIDQCALQPLIERLPRGLSSRISEGGRNLSSGERQRVALARALLGRPRLLLLDELDAHLDTSSREIVEQVLANFAAAVIRVSHHENRHAKDINQLWRLEHGRLMVKTCTTPNERVINA